MARQAPQSNLATKTLIKISPATFTSVRIISGAAVLAQRVAKMRRDVRRECVALSCQAPDPRLGKFQAIAGRIAEID